MADQPDESVVKPEVFLLESLLDDIAAGRLRVPRFQRPFVWGPGQMLELFDSIERGYPIGSVLVWETSSPVPSLDQIAGIDIPAPPADGRVSYLLDGHQRLSTLFGTLGKRLPHGSSDDDMWRIYRRLGAEDTRGVRFQHHPGGEPPSRLLPMQAVLRTMDFLGYARKLARDPDTVDDCDALVDEAEGLAQRIKSYKIAVVRLVGGSLAHAVEAFARLNSAGRQITPQQMVSALTYRPETQDTLVERIAVIRAGIAESGFGELDEDEDIIFQTVTELVGEREFIPKNWSDIAARISGDFDGLLDRTERALHRAVQFLRYEAGVPLAQLLPYPRQMVLLAEALDRVPFPSSAETRILVRWFWTTSWGGGVQAVDPLMVWIHRVADLNPIEAIEQAQSLSAPAMQPFPELFEVSQARVRAYLLWEQREFGQRLDLNGEVVDMIDVVARQGLDAYRPAMPGMMVGYTANHMVLPTPGVPVPRALRDLPPRRLRAVAASHGIPQNALAFMFTGDAEGFVRARAAFLAERERVFIHAMAGREEPDSGQDA